MALSRRQFLLSSAAALVAPAIPVTLSPLIAADFAEVERRFLPLLPTGAVTGRWSSGSLAPGSYVMNVESVKKVGNVFRMVGNVYFGDEHHVVVQNFRDYYDTMTLDSMIRGEDHEDQD